VMSMCKRWGKALALWGALCSSAFAQEKIASIESVIRHDIDAHHATYHVSMVDAVEHLVGKGKRSFRRMGVSYTCDGLVQAGLLESGFIVDRRNLVQGGVEGIYDWVKLRGQLHR